MSYHKISVLDCLMTIFIMKINLFRNELALSHILLTSKSCHQVTCSLSFKCGFTSVSSETVWVLHGSLFFFFLKVRKQFYDVILGFDRLFSLFSYTSHT